MQKSKRFSLTAIAVVFIFPLALVLYTLYDNRSFGLISFILVLLAMLPFFIHYERKKPPVREWMPIAVMAALAAAGRIVFAPLPHCKPTSAIIIVTAMVLGSQAGFLTGVLAALGSNLFFGQGPWTPWQMFAWGLVGFIAGVLGKRGYLHKKWQRIVFGLSSGFIYGWIMNIWTGATMAESLNITAFFYLYITSLPTDIMHGVSTALFLLAISDSWSAKLRRIQYKFGISY